MSFVEFLGLVISIIALLFLSIKQYREARYRKLHPEEYVEEEREKEERMRQFLKSLSMEDRKKEDEEEDEEEFDSPSTVLKVLPQTALAKNSYFKNSREESSPKKSAMMNNYPDNQSKEVLKKSSIHTMHDNAYNISRNAYDVERVLRKSRGTELINKLPSRRELLIIKELFDKPLALRNPRDEL